MLKRKWLLRQISLSLSKRNKIKVSKNEEMSDYLPGEVIRNILNKLPVNSVVRFRSVCKSWNSLICDPSFIYTHLQFSQSNNTPFLLLGGEKDGRENVFSLYYDNDGFDMFKQLEFPSFGCVGDFPVVGSCNGLICVQLDYYDYDLDFVLWNPSIQKFVPLPQVNICEVDYFNVGFGFDSKTKDYKLLIIGVDKGGSWIQPYLFSLNENCWKRVTAVYPKYAVAPQGSLPYVSGAVHWLGYRGRKNGGHSHVILGFDLSAEAFSVINLPESLTGFSPVDLSILKHGESTLAVSVDPLHVELHELWIMKEYGVVESWTKLLTLHRVPRYAWFPKVMGFRKNGDILLRVRYVKMASFDLSSHQMGASLYLNCELMEFQGIEVGAILLSLNSFVESLVFLDKEDNVCSANDVNHPIDSNDLDESSGGD